MERSGRKKWLSAAFTTVVNILLLIQRRFHKGRSEHWTRRWKSYFIKPDFILWFHAKSKSKETNVEFNPCGFCKDYNLLQLKVNLLSVPVLCPTIYKIQLTKNNIKVITKHFF